MPYSEQTWFDGVAGGTPLSATRLNHLEDGVTAAAGVADLAQPAEALDADTAALLADESSALRTTANAAYVGQGVIDTSGDTGFRAEVVSATGSALGGIRIDNEADAYAVKIDQQGTDGVHDAVNISSLFAGEHTPFSVNSLNTTFSTAKVVNSAAQTAGVVIAGVGDNAGRTASIFGADNSGTGSSFLSTMKSGADGIAFQAVYDVGATYELPMFWGSGHHEAGNLFYLENDAAHTSGSVLKLAETNAASTAPVISIANSGTGISISAPSFSVLKDGRTQLKQIENLATFNNGTVRMNDAGVAVHRSVADANPVLTVRNDLASSTGDLLQLKDGGVTVGRFNRTGVFVTKAQAAPTDADVATGELALWFDSTTGAARVKFKGKDAGGTVRTGEVALA